MQHQRFKPRHSVIRQATAILIALTVAGSGGQAWAQSNATATIFGEVQSPAGATVVLENLATGAQRTLTPDASGRYIANSMPPGRYAARVVRGGTVQATQEIEALVGGGAEVNFAAAVDAAATVVVRGARTLIDVSSTNNGVVFTARELKALPVANDIAAVVQLTPGVARGTNSQYGSAPQIGGSGQSENAFYVNGFPITNILTQVGASELPFGAISNMQVLTGGYGSEFGRSTGGVVNITTKSGGNKFEFGGKLSTLPRGLKGTTANTYFPNTGANPKTDGKLLYANQDNGSTSKTIGLYGSGPLIRNKLFAFVALERTKSDSQSVGASTETKASDLRTGWATSNTEVNRYLAKIDYNLAEDHHLEYTKLYDRTTTRSQAYGYSYATQSSTGVPGGSGETTINCCGAASAPGADIDVLKYTGYLTDNLTVTALYGKSRTIHRRSPEGYDPSLPQISSTTAVQVPGLNYPSPQTVTGNLVDPNSGDEQKGKRLDVEYRLGSHSLRAGIDRIDVDSRVGLGLAGGYRWSYHKDAPNAQINGANQTLAQGGGFGTQGYYVSRDYYSNLAHPTSEQSAQYIQDHYQITDRVLLDLGLRREQFTNYTSNGDAFISQRNMIAPRVSASWDYNGDGSLKLSFNAGRYHLPVPSNLSSNMAAPFTSTSEFFTYTGVDPATGAPTGLHALGTKPYSANNAYGQSRDAREVTAIGLKPLSQDEFAFGLEKAFNKKLVAGASFLYRRLNDTNDDSCDQRPIDAWATANKVDTSNWGGFQCAIINPGRDNALWIDFADGKGLRRVDISAAQWGNPKPERTYRALNLFVEHPFSNGWYGKVTYTLSALKGNMEGQTDTIGGGDVGLTVSDDHKELMYNAYGYLPGDHRHAIKAYGFMQVLPELTVGGNLALTSGAPRNCIGNLPDNLRFANDYNSAYFYCKGVATPRGSQGRLPWQAQLDLNLAYTPRYAKGLSLKVDVFNVFDRQTTTRYNETYNDGSGISRNYLQVAGRTSPRSVRLTAEYEF
ncbi:TonB-dependent receptor plug domain-containing protein [Duganella sp. HH101]|uniref:TonB-dependent receptor n=1 Tax=Duganella sp. HH101 TaxID=1781066 RepID=UPI0008742410|nr:TonB-dependent receptor plug domain-containing protein [Duganella sp. HH101]OFA04103.1 TonB-dependent receptor plug domain protein [Duganella sp. HH101]